jgi:hypothetical protein
LAPTHRALSQEACTAMNCLWFTYLYLVFNATPNPRRMLT